MHGEFQPWLKFQPCFEDCVTLKVPLTPKIFVTEIDFRYCPDYFGEKVFSSGFFLRMLFLCGTQRILGQKASTKS